MIRIGRWYIATENELRDLVVEAMPGTIARQAVELVNAELLNAAMAADAHLHEDPAHPLHDQHRRSVCEQLVSAVGAAQAAGRHL